MCASAVFRPTDSLLFSMPPGALQGPDARGSAGRKAGFRNQRSKLAADAHRHAAAAAGKEVDVRIGAVGHDEGADVAPAREVFAAHLHAPGAAPVFGAQAQQGVAPLRVAGGVGVIDVFIQRLPQQRRPRAPAARASQQLGLDEVPGRARDALARKRAAAKAVVAPRPCGAPVESAARPAFRQTVQVQAAFHARFQAQF